MAIPAREDKQPDGRKVIRFRPVSAADTPKAIERLVRLFNDAIEGNKSDALALIAAFILDLSAFILLWTATAVGRC